MKETNSKNTYQVKQTNRTGWFSRKILLNSQGTIHFYQSYSSRIEKSQAKIPKVQGCSTIMKYANINQLNRIKKKKHVIISTAA